MSLDINQLVLHQLIKRDEQTLEVVLRDSLLELFIDMVTKPQSYREKVSQMISWGHWFALFNIILSLLLGSRYFNKKDDGNANKDKLPFTRHFTFIWINHEIPNKLGQMELKLLVNGDIKNKDS